MSGKVKTLLAVLALGALVSLLFFLSSFRTDKARKSGTATGLDALSQSNPCGLDTDKDGLSDCEESYWDTDFQNSDTDGDGFKDGEEVISGHDPAKKGPEDFLDKRGNVTRQAATLMLGGMTVGDLLPESQNYKDSIESYSQAIIDRYRANSQVPDITLTVGGDRQADLLNYGMASANIVGMALKNVSISLVPVIQTIADTNMSDLSGLKTAHPEKYRAFIAAIDMQINALTAPITKLTTMPVPSAVIPGHKNILIFLRSTQQQYRLVRQVAQDPIQALLALQTLQTLTRSTSIDIAQDFAIRLNNALTQ